jgi:FtsP/CotA-like multicopper oxidase with cupredoxin domain
LLALNDKGKFSNSQRGTSRKNGPFTVVARDGVTLSSSARYDADTINLGPGQRYDVIWPARKPGKWLIHCHIPHHTENDNVEEKGGGGLMMLIDVADK